MQLTTARLTLEIERRGTGPRVLFIGGTGGDLRRTPGVFDGPLGAAGFDLLAFDQRGLGRSERPPGPYGMDDYADDAAALLDAVDWPDCLVVGVSFGGMVAQELTLRHPDRVRALVLCCTSSGGEGGASWPLERLETLPEAERDRLRLTLNDRRRTPRWQAEHPERVQRMLDFMHADAAVGAEDPDRARGLALQLEARAGHDTWDRLESIRVPTLVCAGRYDGIAPPENAEALARRIPGAELAWFEGGHLFLVQDRAAWPRVIAWLEAHG
ncbi:MAG: alpha/beta fold hydrolase [Pseudomonadales bacterium]|jgi:3-oxoadipate enol-lactonase|nr:alpha/beta fold hydrolase [Pseudomonadales bacterium]